MKYIFIAIISLLLCACRPSARNFYVDSIAGEDYYSGTASNGAWKSLEKLNEQEFRPGDRIFFKSGTEYLGQFSPKGNGTGEAPIVVDKFGEGEKPILHGEGKKQYTILLDGVSYWEVNNLEITNQGPEAMLRKVGVWVKAVNTGDRYHINLKNLTIHDVNGSMDKEKGGGILWQVDGDSLSTRFVGLLIEKCHFYRCCPNSIIGINDGKECMDGYGSRVVLRKNTIEQIGGKAIEVTDRDSVLMENNIIRTHS